MSLQRIDENPNLSPMSSEEFSVLRQQAEIIAKSGLAPRGVSTPEKILVIALKGRELSMPPMQALSQIYVVDGKPTLSAEGMVALVQRAGHILRIIESTDERATVEGVRRDDPNHPQRLTFTMEEAKRAGVADKGVWRQYPAAMLRARAISALCRFCFADVLAGCSYVPEELGAPVGEDGEVIEAEPADESLPDEDGELIHDELLAEILTTANSIPQDARPDLEKVYAFAEKSIPAARKALARMKKIADEAASHVGEAG